MVVGGFVNFIMVFFIIGVLFMVVFGVNWVVCWVLLVVMFFFGWGVFCVLIGGVYINFYVVK